MTEPSSEAFNTTAKIEAAKRDMVMNLTGMTLLTIVVVVFLACCTTYCTTPRAVDQEAQAVRIVEGQLMQQCVARGGSWMPVRKSSGSYETAMSCITPQTLPLATKMNTDD